MYIFPDTLTGILVHVFQISVALIAPIFLDHPNKDLYVTSRGIISLKVFDFFNPVNVIVSTGFGLYWWAIRPLRDARFSSRVEVLLSWDHFGSFELQLSWAFLHGCSLGLPSRFPGRDRLECSRLLSSSTLDARGTLCQAQSPFFIT